MAFTPEQIGRMQRNGYTQQTSNEYRKYGPSIGEFESIVSKDTSGYSYWHMIPEQAPIVKQYETFEQLAADVLPIQ